MKRSQINALQREAVQFFAAHHFHLPPWAFWSPGDWAKNKDRAREIKSLRLGWDLTDFGAGDFYHIGLLLFTLRNGLVDQSGSKDYAEKVMIVREQQLTPLHFHWYKMEDLINRGGGNLVIEMWNSSSTEELAAIPVTVMVDGIPRTLKASESLVLTPGESVTLPPRLYHQFYGKKGKGPVLVGEVSRVNDDSKDNRFFKPAGRFPKIEEDEEPLYLLCNEYP
ncbi:MAG: D-lyxose/D-mannose family sugar isomerase [bacterium]